MNSYQACQIISGILKLALNVLFQLLTHKQPNLESVKKVEKITSLGAKLWKILPHDYKELTSL